MRILIVGGVAGGASVAARARRLSESAEIVMFDRGEYVSFANCGLPYYVGEVIRDEDKLLVATPELFLKRFNIDVRLRHEVLSVDRAAREIEVKDLKTGVVTREPYDALVLSPGAKPIRPPLPGIDLPGIFVLRTIPDSRRVREWIKTHAVNRAVIVGGGFIGIEMAENLRGLGMDVTLVERMPQLMPPLDAEMAVPVQEHLELNGVDVRLNDAVAKFEEAAGGLKVFTESGAEIEAGLVVLAIGVRPEVTLAKEAGLEIGERGGIRVDARMQTSDQQIWAVGDAVEVEDYITGEWTAIPLAGPANRQGRIAANTIMGRDSEFRGVQGTSVCSCFDLTIACTGANERTLQRAKIPYQKAYLFPGNHVGYYPGASSIHIKLLFSPETGRVLGAQAIGESGVEKRIDVIAMAIQMKASVWDIEEAELCYAPQYGAAKDPVNIAGMIAANALNGDAPLAHWADLDTAKVTLLDVRSKKEVEDHALPDAVNIPLDELRGSLNKLSKDKPLWVYCAVGQRGYYAVRLLRQHGFEAYNLSGGIHTHDHLPPAQ